MLHQMQILLMALAVYLLGFSKSRATEPQSVPERADLKWIEWPDARLETRGLPWLRENTPELWRLPKGAKEQVPKSVWSRAVAPDGGRIRFSCNSTRLAVRIQAMRPHQKPCYLDAFIDGQYTGSANAAGTQRVDVVVYEKQGQEWKDITLYLPHNQEARFFAVGVDANAEFKAPRAFALQRPVVCYGSSVLQGTGAAHPSKTYPAATARRLNLDFVNLGFGGAGKAEAEVVTLVNQLDACCYLFDLGKSYGTPTPERYCRMLDTIRTSHPGVPIVCVTPIYSTKEEKDPAYKKRSEDLRTIMRQAATERQQAGDKYMFVVEGLYLFGAGDQELFHDPLHPNDAGNERMAERLAPILEKVLFERGLRVGEKPDARTNSASVGKP